MNSPGYAPNEGVALSRRQMVEVRLLNSRLAGLYRTMVAAACETFAAYYRLMPDPGAKVFLWHAVGERYLFARGYETLARMRNGMTIRCNLGDVLQRYVAVFGVWEPDITAYLCQRLRPGDLFVDIGANIGYHSLLAAGLVRGSGRVIAVEANPATASLLRDNIQRNRCGNIRIEQAAVVGEVTKVPLYSGGADNIGAVTTVADRGQGFLGWAEGKKLDDVLSPEEVENTRVIKIDVEGAEAPILRSLLQMTRRMRPDLEILVEASPSPEMQVILDGFTSSGFRLYEIANAYEVTSYVGRRRLGQLRPVTGPLSRQTDIVISAKPQPTR